MRRRLRNAIGRFLGYYGCLGCGQTTWRYRPYEWHEHQTETGRTLGVTTDHGDCAHCGRCPLEDA